LQRPGLARRDVTLMHDGAAIPEVCGDAALYFDRTTARTSRRRCNAWPDDAARRAAGTARCESVPVGRVGGTVEGQLADLGEGGMSVLHLGKFFPPVMGGAAPVACPSRRRSAAC